MNRKLFLGILMVSFIIHLLLVCETTTSKGPQEKWGDRKVFIYKDMEHGHYGCTLVEDGVEGVDIIFWSMNGLYLDGLQNTRNFNRLMDSKEG